MAELFRFFDSTATDQRLYGAEDFAEYFRQFIGNGIFQGGDQLQVGSDQVGMKTFVTPGKAYINGYFYHNTSNLSLDHSVAHNTYPRIDRVVLRLDHETRTVRLDVLTGVPDSTPQPPELTRSTLVHEISLAQVRVNAGVVSISPAQIIDERYNDNLCGIVTHLFEKVDTTNIFQQFQQAWEDWFDEVQDTTNLVTRTEFTDFQEQVAVYMPPGGIIMWSGAVDNIPAGWTLCDGTDGAPDLRDRFIVGAGGEYETEDTGGLKEVSLTTSEMPSHDHSGSARSAGSHSHGSGTLGTNSTGAHTHNFGGVKVMESVTGRATGQDKYVYPDRWDYRTESSGSHSHTVSGSTSSAGSHSHTLSINSAGDSQAHENRPPYFALAFIMKL